MHEAIDPIGAITQPIGFPCGPVRFGAEARIASKDIAELRSGTRDEAFKQGRKVCVPTGAVNEFDDANGMRGCPQNMFDLRRIGQGMQIR